MKKLFDITDVFQITGRGCVVTGKADPNVIFKIGDPVTVVRNGSVILSTSISGVEMIRYTSVEAMMERRDFIGLLLNEIKKDEIQPGDMLICNAPAY